MARARDRALPPLAIAVFVVLLALPTLSQPWTIDEPVFLAVARHILKDPFHPYAFDFNWYGRAVSMGSINGNPPLFPYALALCLRLAGGAERAVRLALLPLALIAALALYALASRFTRRPLWPALAVVVSPAFAINLPHAMPEALLAALALPGLYACLRGVDEADGRFFWVSAVLFAGALLTKYAGVFLLAPAVLYALKMKVPARKLAGFLLVACGPLAAYLLHAGGMTAVAHALSQSSVQDYASPAARLRATLAFTGGLGSAAAVWSRPKPKTIAAAAALAAALFLTAHASWPARAQGFLFAFAAVCALGAVREEGNFFLSAWTACGLLLAACYWSVTARTVLFALPPLAIAAALRLEKAWDEKRARVLQSVSVAALAAISLALARVDSDYARAQRGVAELAAISYPGHALWCASHWGLQHYMAERGARELDWSRGGWDQVEPGDVVVLSSVNSNVLWPEKRVDAEMRKISVDSPIPLRLMSGWGGEAGFYSNKNGFLPFALSREPVDEFLVAEVQK